MDSGIDKIRDKIRKLFALSKSPNENEATTAMEKAVRLMDEYNLSENQCLYERHLVKATKRLSRWRNLLSNTVAWLYCCQVYLYPSTGELLFFGEALEVFMATEMYRYLSKRIDRMVKLNMGKNAKKPYREKYRLEVAYRLAERIHELGAGSSWAPEREHRRLAAKRIFEIEVITGKPRTLRVGGTAFKRGASDGAEFP